MNCLRCGSKPPPAAAGAAVDPYALDARQAYNEAPADEDTSAEAARRRARAAQLRQAGGQPAVLDADLRRDLPLLRDVARLSLYSYCSPEEAETRYNDARAGQSAPEDNFGVLGKVPVMPEFYGGDDCCAYLMPFPAPDGVSEGGRRPDLLVLTVRGLASLEDSLCDKEVAQVPLTTDNLRDFAADVRVHEHFHQQYLSLESIFDARLHDHLASSPSARLLGAITALVYAALYPGKVWFIGIGMPMTGNGPFQREFDKLVGLRWRVKNSRDVVPKIRLSPYYAHVGRELLVGRVDPYPDLAMFSDLPDHFCPQYIKGLDELSDSWFSMLDLTAILPLRIHAALINSSYRIWRYCTQLSGE